MRLEPGDWGRWWLERAVAALVMGALIGLLWLIGRLWGWIAGLF